MSNIVEGIVEKVNKTNAPDGKWKKVAVFVKGNWYSGFVNKDTSDDRSKVKEGDAVKVEYKQSGRFLNIESVYVTASHESEDKAVPATTETYVPSNVRDLRITVAGARNTAVEFVRLALDKEVLSLGSGKKGKQVDVLLDHVNQYTEVFARQLLDANDVDLLGQKNKKPQAEAAKTDDSYTE